MSTTTSERATRRLATAALIVLALVVSIIGPAVPARASFTPSPYSQGFDSLANSGTGNTWSDNVTLPLWYSNRTTYNAGNGSSNTGALYSFGSTGSADRALGGVASGGTGTIFFGVQLTNNTGATITGLDITYTGEQWRTGGSATAGVLSVAQKLDFQYQANAPSLTGGTWVDFNTLDFTSPIFGVGATELDGNAVANRTTLSGSLTGLNLAPNETIWLRWQDINDANNDHGLAVDDLSVTAVTVPAENQPIAATATPASITTDEGVAASSDLSATDPDGTVSGASITAGDVAGISLDGFVAAGAAGGAATATLNVASSVAPGTYNVVVTFTNADATPQSTDLTVPVTVVAAPTITRIHEIQGAGSAVTGPGPFTVEAVVVGDYQTQGSGQLRGFFLQEEDADADADPATSEGIFVFCTTCPVPVEVGDLVRVTGAASEFFDMSQLTASTVASVTVLDSDQPLPTPAALELPVPITPSGDLAADTAAINAYYEPFEGMLVTFPDTLSVSEYFELARYGQVILTEGGRPHTFTAVNPPSAAGLIDHEIDLARRTVILDDTDNRQNRPVDTPNTPYYHPAPGLSTGNFFRGGDTIAGLTGVLHWSFAGQAGTDAWRIRPVVEEFSYAFTSVNPRPAAPEVEGRLKVASFNVLNYFLTVDTTSSNNVGTCGPSGTLDCRGADSAQELERQRAKLTRALIGLDADVLGLMEMENTPGVTPSLQIVEDLNAALGADIYDYVDTGAIGTDAIRLGIIYKRTTVSPLGAHAILDSSVDPRYIDTRNRPALAQSFEEIGTGARFTVVVNHLKSKGSGCGPGDDDTTTGQGNCNGTRTLAAQALADWLAGDPTGSGDSDVLIIGDLNSYAKEDPIVALQSAGYTDLVAQFGGPGAYGYVFDGQLGYLDHALSNPSLTPQVADVAEWHINADEIPLFDYNDDVRDPGEAAFEEESSVLPLYEPNAFRTSDHDPVIVGLNLTIYRARQVGGNVWIERNIAEAGLGDVDGDPVDGWALVGRTNGANERGELRGFFEQGGVPYAIVFNGKLGRCILVTPASLDPVGPGNGRTTVVAQDPAPYCPAP